MEKNMADKDTKLTSVKVIESLYDSFKIFNVRAEPKLSLQKLTNRCLYLYLNDEEFRDKINTNSDLIISGSNF